MKPICLPRMVVVVSLTVMLVIAVPVLAGEPTEQIRETTDKIISVLSDPVMKDSAKDEERKRLLRQIANERFDWEEMSRRALARHWSERSDEEKQEFILLFSDLLERTYMDRVDSYSGEKVLYDGDMVDGDYGIVRVRVITNDGREFPTEYRVRKRGDGWFIYDISVKGVSLVNNYRTQFNSIIVKSDYPTLVERMKAKLEEY